MTLTQHAQVRMQQRSIPEVMVEALLEWGRSTFIGGVEKVYFDKASRRRVVEDRDFEALTRNRPNLLDIYLVRIDDCVVTVAYRQKRIGNN